jgi:hypothetical protein
MPLDFTVHRGVPQSVPLCIWRDTVIAIVTVNQSSDNNNDDTSIHSLQEAYDTCGRTRWISSRLSLMHIILTYQERYLACVRGTSG